MSMLRILTCLAATATLMELAMAANYVVGGTNGGWDTVTNLQAWAASQTFYAGDNLIFQYTANHDVVEVSKAEYDSCQVTNPIQTYTDTNSVVPLTTPGTQYFICGSPGHCSIGMKVQIDTLAATTAASAPPAPAPSSDDVVDPLVPAVSTPTALPSYGPAISPLSPSNSPANSPTSAFYTPFGRSNTNTLSQDYPSAANNVMVGSIVGFGFFIATFLIL